MGHVGRSAVVIAFCRMQPKITKIRRRVQGNKKNKGLQELFHKAIILRSAIRKRFQEFDKNGDGYITKKEFRGVMRKQKKITESQLDAMVKQADKNGDGKIDYDEFLVMMTKG